VQHPGTDLRTETAGVLTLDAERAIPLALVLAELVEGAVRRAVGFRASEPMRLSARRKGRTVWLELTDAGAGEEDGEAQGLSAKVVRALTRQIGAVLETERLPCGRFRTTLSLPREPAKPTRS
jgi:two-component sensor histidine kinase